MWKIFTEKKIKKVEKKIHEFIPNILATEFFATYSEFFSTIFRRIFEYEAPEFWVHFENTK